MPMNTQLGLTACPPFMASSAFIVEVLRLDALDRSKALHESQIVLGDIYKREVGIHFGE
jgi:hypothetical protein